MRAGHEEGGPLTLAQVNAWDNCLGCMACVTACPSGVQYDEKLIEDTRGQVERQWCATAPRATAAARAIFAMFPYPDRMEVGRAVRALRRAVRALPQALPAPAHAGPARAAEPAPRQAARADRGAGDIKSNATVVNKMVLGNRYQQSSFKGTYKGKPFEGIGTLAYDNSRKMFISTWIDNTGTGMMSAEGPWDPASKSITFRGTMSDPATGKLLDTKVNLQAN